MSGKFAGWCAVADNLLARAQDQARLAAERGERAARLNAGQRASLNAIAERLPDNGLIIADEVGMGKTRIATELVRAVRECGGRTAVLIPPGLGYQWQAELREAGVEAPGTLRSLWTYFEAWRDDAAPRPWFNESVLLLSHVFTNWRLGEAAHAWRWTLLPETVALWIKRTTGSFPYGYHQHDQLGYPLVRKAAESIVAHALRHPRDPSSGVFEELVQADAWRGGRLLDAAQYSRDGDWRDWLECIIGVGLGTFDLIIIDEAHKSRNDGSGLSRLIDNVLLHAKNARRIGVTATPVELHADQWMQTLARIGLDPERLEPAKIAIQAYAGSVARLRLGWRTSPEARDDYFRAAGEFKRGLAPYLLRRDKREDDAVKLFQASVGDGVTDYRRDDDTTAIAISPRDLDLGWRQAIFAAEALSLVASHENDPVAKRLRLTLGNGHAIGTLLDQLREPPADQQEIVKSEKVEISARDAKRLARAAWWKDSVFEPALRASDRNLFDHPAILAAVKAIEQETRGDQKVLVFGRYTKPLRALVGLLNAREMLRCVHERRPWPKSKVHGDDRLNADISEWPAVHAAHRQLDFPILLDELDETLGKQYSRLSAQRERLRADLLVLIERGLRERTVHPRMHTLFSAFRCSAENAVSSDTDRHPLALVSRAIIELTGHPTLDSRNFSADEVAAAFIELVDAVGDADDFDEDGNVDEASASQLWEDMERRLDEEYNRPQGGFARLMYGGTSHESRRMLQLAFNRPNSFPKVLVAQSMVGREGLNLHKACRVVVLLHPEWNPAVVEQQIGRVDRVGSRWSVELERAVAAGKRGDELPRIDVRPVIFQGTYDEHNWDVLRQRWDDLRAQLHGIVIPARLADMDAESHALLAELAAAAPNFSPGAG